MPANLVQKLVELAQPLHPVEQPKPQDWERVERELGLPLPPDYKSLLTALGSGEFGVGLGLKNPVSTSEHARLSADALRRYRQTVVFLEDRMGITLFPQPQGLVLIGGVDRQHLLYRPTENSKTVSRLVNLDHEYEVTREFDLSLSQFIHDLYLGQIHDEWAKQLRASVWIDDTIPFFKSRPGAKS
jgi:hypothetical protein